MTQHCLCLAPHSHIECSLERCLWSLCWLAGICTFLKCQANASWNYHTSWGGANYIQLVLWQGIHPAGVALLADNKGLTSAWGQDQAANKAGSSKAQGQARPLKLHASCTACAGWAWKDGILESGFKRGLIPSSNPDTE